MEEFLFPTVFSLFSPHSHPRLLTSHSNHTQPTGRTKERGWLPNANTGYKRGAAMASPARGSCLLSLPLFLDSGAPLPFSSCKYQGPCSALRLLTRALSHALLPSLTTHLLMTPGPTLPVWKSHLCHETTIQQSAEPVHSDVPLGPETPHT